MSEPHTHHRTKLQIFWAKYGGTGFIISVVLHGTLLLAALGWVVNEYIINPPVEMQAPPPAQENKAVKQIDFTIATQQQKQRSSAAPVNVQRITVDNASSLALPETPNLTSMGGNPFDVGQGGGLNMQGGGGRVVTGPVVRITPFGLRNMQGAAFRGNLYDLKQTPQNKLIEPRANFVTVVKAFFDSGWSQNTLRRFYQAPTPLYNTQFYIPWMNAIEAPKAFNAEQQIAPSMWLALYEARVSPPSSGRYRFIGAADDLVAVRFNKKFALEAYWGGTISSEFSPSGYMEYPSIKDRIPGFPKGFVCGEWLTLDQNQAYEMQVLLGERPGGQYWGYLFVEKEGDNTKKTGKGDPILTIFRVRQGITDESKDARGWSAPFVSDKEAPVWKVFSSGR